jgi:hypothetical protein
MASEPVMPQCVDVSFCKAREFLVLFERHSLKALSPCDFKCRTSPLTVRHYLGAHVREQRRQLRPLRLFQHWHFGLAAPAVLRLRHGRG